MNLGKILGSAVLAASLVALAPGAAAFLVFADASTALVVGGACLFGLAAALAPASLALADGAAGPGRGDHGRRGGRGPNPGPAGGPLFPGTRTPAPCPAVRPSARSRRAPAGGGQIDRPRPVARP